jgi:hypothetical protein
MPHIIKMMIKIIRARKVVRVRRHNKRDNERVRDIIDTTLIFP